MDVSRDPTNWPLRVVKVTVGVIVFAIAYGSLWFWDTFRDHCDSGGDAVLAELEQDPMSSLDIPDTSDERHTTQRQCTDSKGTNRGPETWSYYVVEDRARLRAIADLASATATRAGWEDIETKRWSTITHSGSIHANRSLTVDSTEWEAELLVIWSESYDHPGQYQVTIRVRAREHFDDPPLPPATLPDATGGEAAQ